MTNSLVWIQQTASDVCLKQSVKEQWAKAHCCGYSWLFQQVASVPCPEKQAKVKEYETEIDYLVYQLYGLTEDEIAIIEKSSKNTGEFHPEK